MKIHRVLYYLLLFFLPTQLGLHLWPAWSYILGRRIDYLSPTIHVTDILLVLMIVFWAIEPRAGLWNFVVRIKEKRKKIFQTLSFIRTVPLLVFVLILIIGNILNASNTMLVLYKWVKVAEFSLFFYYIKITRPSFVKSSLAFLLAMIYTSTIAIVQFVFQRSIGGVFWFLGERTFELRTPGIARFDWCGLFYSSCRPILRPYGTFPHPNVLAGHIVALLPAFVFLVQKKRSFFLIPATVFLSFVTLALTFSRSALVVGFIVLCLYFVLRPFNNRKTIMILLVMLSFTTLTMVIFAKQWPVSSESILVRQDLNTNAVVLWKTSPLFGVGLGNSIVSLPGVMRIKHVYFLQPIHNIYLLVLAETGIAGAIFFFWFIIKVFGRLQQQRTSKHRALVLVKTFSLASILLLGFIDHYSLTLQQGQLLFTYIIGMSYIDHRNDDMPLP